MSCGLSEVKDKKPGKIDLKHERDVGHYGEKFWQISLGKEGNLWGFLRWFFDHSVEPYQKWLSSQKEAYLQGLCLPGPLSDKMKESFL